MVDYIKIGVGEGIRFYLCPGVLDAHGPTVAKVILVPDGCGLLGYVGGAYVSKVGFQLGLKTSTNGVYQCVGIVGDHECHRLFLDGVDDSFCLGVLADVIGLYWVVLGCWGVLCFAVGGFISLLANGLCGVGTIVL